MTFRMLDFIERKRDGFVHDEASLAAFVAAVRDESIPDYQTAAWLMATYLNGMRGEELANFTRSLAESGDVVKLPGDGGAVDKHSTGGVGDKTTLVVAPLVAACGVRVAKLSGRGLGFTGGTVDKLESIPGMNVHLSTKQFIDQVDRLGAAISGHSLELAPAEGKFYALRDVTGTVPSLPLIASSIVSKKIAGGADAFVFDVKCGSGAFMQSYPEAEALSGALVELSRTLGRRSICLISDMEQPLGEWVGNAVEVYEAIEVLAGGGPADTRGLSLALAAEMLVVAGRAEDTAAARQRVAAALDDGSALEKLRSVISAQSGDGRICDDPAAYLPRAEHRMQVLSPVDGYLTRLDAKGIGCAVRALGGGRTRKEDAVDLAVGLKMLKKVGSPVSHDEPLIEIYYNTEDQLQGAMPYVHSALGVGEEPTAPRPLLLGRVPDGGR